jgi:hypothetical protein
MPDGMINSPVSNDELNARVDALIRRRNKRDDTAIIEATKLFPIWQAYVATKPDEEQGLFLLVGQQIEEIVWKTLANSDAALLARVEFSLEHGEVTQWQERSVLENVRDSLRARVEKPSTGVRNDLALDALREMESEIHDITAAAGVLVHMGSSDFNLEGAEVEWVAQKIFGNAGAISKLYDKVWPLCGGAT